MEGILSGSKQHENGLKQFTQNSPRNSPEIHPKIHRNIHPQFAKIHATFTLQELRRDMCTRFLASHAAQAVRFSWHHHLVFRGHAVFCCTMLSCVAALHQIRTTFPSYSMRGVHVIKHSHMRSEESTQRPMRRTVCNKYKAAETASK